jgi:hypothetical protein
MSDLYINAYEITGADDMRWPVRRFGVRRADGVGLKHEDRSRVKNAAFGLRSEYRAQCSGYGFIVDADEETIVVPRAWQFPARMERDGLVFGLKDEFDARPSNLTHDGIVAGIFREAFKRHLKDRRSDHLGPLWQDYSRFCQMPQLGSRDRVAHCKGFEVLAKRMAGQRWVVTIAAHTTAIDGRSIADYFSRGEAADLADLIQSKRESYSRRDNGPAVVRAFAHGVGGDLGRIVEIDEPDVLAAYESMSAADQRLLVGQPIRCHSFMRDSDALSPGSLSLVLDTQQTEELHSDTILEPAERFHFTAEVRQHLLGADLYNSSLALSDTPVNCKDSALLIGPPALRIKSQNGIDILACAEPISEGSIRARARERKDRVVKNGFLVSRPMRPLLAVPERLTDARAKRLHNECNSVLRNHGINSVSFDLERYRDVNTLRKVIDQRGYDSVLAVLPDHRPGSADDDTYDRIKRSLEVPSQCMQMRGVVPATWADRPTREMWRNDPRLARSLRNRLDLTVINLLVKHNWVPFSPASPYHFNVHIGLDVGGVHNTNAVACVGYGFAVPSGELVFRLEELPIPIAKKEPIPSQALRNGLLAILERIAEAVEDAGTVFDLTRMLVYRDGRLLGRGDAWNETDAFHQLYRDATERGWVRGESEWAALEIMKGAEGLRVFEMLPQPANPLVGRCTFPFDEPDTALVSTTGRPYLPQGTAAPLKVKLVQITGKTEFENALRDLVWQCDLGFTKPDMGFSLPWVLHVADAGALQLSRSYKVTGIAA